MSEGKEAFARKIFEGDRNNMVSRFAGRILKRYGKTKEAEEAFAEYAKRCVPPLPKEELDTVWRSALKFYEKRS